MVTCAVGGVSIVVTDEKVLRLSSENLMIFKCTNQFSKCNRMLLLLPGGWKSALKFPSSSPGWPCT